MDGNQADEVEVFGLFGGDLPVMHQSRKPDCGKWIGDCPHNAPVGAKDQIKFKMMCLKSVNSARTGK
ncbi:hypothetical protein NKT34_00505 [Paenibacillus polysaccharolyticus]|uniref:hypothetical protein n=1 Tax=Paenibacillus polysaccharolyticus TaxID=582692 RepID=UPI0020A00177|nr:hypothetical protein [Paenibacillus polysaccharolyticus]MCP1131780.1 hypothetical protein [Paenibacillus polysaccharolyticus]